MYISWSVHHKESCVKLRYAYIIKCSSQGKLFKVAVCIYHQVFITRKVVLSCSMYISCSVYHKESCLKLRYGYIMIECLSQGKLFKLRYVYIRKCSSIESCLKMRYEYIMAFSSQGKLF